MTRHAWVVIHRWAGLVMAGFLIIVGLTGSLLAFYPELQRALNPHWYPDREPATWLPASALAEQVESQDLRVQVIRIELSAFDETTTAWVAPRHDPATHEIAELDADRLILDPATGEVLDRRRYAAITQGWANLMDFIYSLHYALALGMTGMWILGICALVWTVDCFVGFYLTLPAGPGVKGTAPKTLDRSWWARWKPAWLVKLKSSAYRLNFDLHRAGGLWTLVLLLIFAWSSVYMNLWDTVYTWTTQTLFEYHTIWTEIPPRAQPLEQPKLSWREAQARGEALMAEQSAQHGFAVEQPVALGFDAERGTYTWQVRTNMEIDDRSRRYTTQVLFDADTGALRLVLLPSGQYTGNTISNWLYALHMANVFGLPYRIFVCLLGLVVTMLSVTGVYIWSKKRRSRLLAAARRLVSTQTEAAQ
ncbi:MAG: PepSY-associated TM helix domain-containing protein [Nitrospiraceae bacterium]